MNGSSSTTTATGFSLFLPSPLVGATPPPIFFLSSFLAAIAASFSSLRREDLEGGSVGRAGLAGAGAAAGWSAGAEAEDAMVRLLGVNEW